MQNSGDFFKRPEFVTLIVAGLVTLAQALHLPEQAGLPIPEGALGSVVLVAWSVFIGSLLEGGVKKVDYVGTLKGIFVDSLKMRGLYVAFTVAVVGGLARAVGADIPEETLAELVTFFVPLILGKAAIDANAAAVAKATS